MDKLIKLLNEYREKELGYHVPEWEEKGQLGIITEQLISKKFGFIGWLVDNDKIETDGILSDNLTYTYFQIPQEYYMGGCQSLMMQMNKLFYLRIVACLSIQDNPIDFLISILK